MYGSFLRFIISFILFIHGVGHIIIIIPAVYMFVKKKPTVNWLENRKHILGLPNNVKSKQFALLVFILLSFCAFVFFLASAAGLQSWIIRYELWRTFAISASFLSLFTQILYWNVFNFMTLYKIGSVIINCIILYNILWINWPSDLIIGNYL